VTHYAAMDVAYPVHIVTHFGYNTSDDSQVCPVRFLLAGNAHHVVVTTAVSL
jgi:hypothetical protein